ncbi:MAG: hypothetical protein SGARI_001840 [Bacillariaceae sp.]
MKITIVLFLVFVGATALAEEHAPVDDETGVNAALRGSVERRAGALARRSLKPKSKRGKASKAAADAGCEDSSTGAPTKAGKSAKTRQRGRHLNEGDGDDDDGAAVDDCNDDDSPLPQVLDLSIRGPGAAFVNQEFDYTIAVTNTGSATTTSTVVEINIPAGATFVDSLPGGTMSGNVVAFAIGDLPPDAIEEITVTVRAPSDDAILTLDAMADADNAAPVIANITIQVGVQTLVVGGESSAGTGLRMRNNGTISINDIPDGATVSRVVLVWALLYTGTPPTNEIPFEGVLVTADLTATISQTLCWGDTATIGYAADVTKLVKGNGEYLITDPVNGNIRIDSNPSGVLPYTDGASLFVFYQGNGFEDQVLSDFSYSASN